MYSSTIHGDDRLGVENLKEFENQIDGWLQNNKDIVQARNLQNLSDTELICQLLQKIDSRSFSKYHKHVGNDLAKKNGNILAIGQFSFKLGVPFDFLLTTRDFELENKKAFYKFLGVILYIGGILSTWDCPAAILSKSFYFRNYLGENLDLQVPDYSKLDSFAAPQDNMNFKLCLRELYPNWILTYAIAKDIRKHLRSTKKDDSTFKYLAATSRSSSVASSRSGSRMSSRKMSFSLSNDQDTTVSSSQMIGESTQQFSARSQVLSNTKRDGTSKTFQQIVLPNSKNFHSSIITDDTPKVYGMDDTFRSVIPGPPAVNDTLSPDRVIPIENQNPNTNKSALDNSNDRSGVNKSIQNQNDVNKSIPNQNDVNKSINKSRNIKVTNRDVPVNNSLNISNKSNSINQSTQQNRDINNNQNSEITEFVTEIEEIQQYPDYNNYNEFEYGNSLSHGQDYNPSNIYGTNQGVNNTANGNNGQYMQSSMNNDSGFPNDPSTISYLQDPSQFDPESQNQGYDTNLTDGQEYYDANDPQYANTQDQQGQGYYDPNNPNGEIYPQNGQLYYDENDPNGEYGQNGQQYYGENDSTGQYQQTYNNGVYPNQQVDQNDIGISSNGNGQMEIGGFSGLGGGETEEISTMEITEQSIDTPNQMQNVLPDIQPRSVPLTSQTKPAEPSTCCIIY